MPYKIIEGSALQVEEYINILDNEYSFLEVTHFSCTDNELTVIVYFSNENEWVNPDDED